MNEPTHAQAEILPLLEAKFAEPLLDFAALTPWLNETAALGDRYAAAGGTLEDLQARFNETKTPLGGRFFFSTKGPF